ncbi:hypothetical protein M422DRAFT_274685 [Sphaerobolus stellatus SS14]|uniref:Uncharacterized protein n=1 Tax=Sphaerobolus stellatus (strain SS14) TaxID=990650 RepID=A0A0C9UH58_SPHS4|nr:hypothetical protein M422DRAFT_274685 [Sphaerobolus stellatus SS14]
MGTDAHLIENIQFAKRLSPVQLATNEDYQAICLIAEQATARLEDKRAIKRREADGVKDEAPEQEMKQAAADAKVKAADGDTTDGGDKTNAKRAKLDNITRKVEVHKTVKEKDKQVNHPKAYVKVEEMGQIPEASLTTPAAPSPQGRTGLPAQPQQVAGPSMAGPSCDALIPTPLIATTPIAQPAPQPAAEMGGLNLAGLNLAGVNLSQVIASAVASQLRNVFAAQNSDCLQFTREYIFPYNIIQQGGGVIQPQQMLPTQSQQQMMMLLATQMLLSTQAGLHNGTEVAQFEHGHGHDRSNLLGQYSLNVLDTFNDFLNTQNAQGSNWGQ